VLTCRWLKRFQGGLGSLDPFRSVFRSFREKRLSMIMTSITMKTDVRQKIYQITQNVAKENRILMSGGGSQNQKLNKLNHLNVRKLRIKLNKNLDISAAKASTSST